jgi:3-hydroxyisobutyrate dehydrogenase
MHHIFLAGYWAYDAVTMALFKCKHLGFIGIGAMGRPMVGHLANKLPSDTQLHVFDVSEDAVEAVCREFPGRIQKGASARDVAEKSVRESNSSSSTLWFH